MKVHKAAGGWEYWYDRQGGNVWYAAKFDPEGNQIGPAIDAATKPEILRAIERGF